MLRARLTAQLGQLKAVTYVDLDDDDLVDADELAMRLDLAAQAWASHTFRPETGWTLEDEQ